MTWWVEYKKLICFVVVLISSSIATKLIFGNISVDLGAVSMFDMLSISIAFFAIGISFAFYFQASNTSNQFYDNTYKFTNEVSEILGRIEGAFGEKLSHLDDSYSRMDKKLDRNFNPQAAEEKLEENEDEKESTLLEQRKLIDELIEKSHMSAKERDSFYENWQSTQKRLMQASEEISLLNRRLEKYRDSKNSSIFNQIDDGERQRLVEVQSMMYRYLKNEPEVLDSLLEGDRQPLIDWYKTIPQHKPFRLILRNLGFESDGELTEFGLRHWRRAAVRNKFGENEV